MLFARAMTALTLRLSGARPRMSSTPRRISKRCSRLRRARTCSTAAALAAEDLCARRPQLVEPLNALIERYLSITTALDGEAA